jgi:hypothetical protein
LSVIAFKNTIPSAPVAPVENNKPIKVIICDAHDYENCASLHLVNPFEYGLKVMQ